MTGKRHGLKNSCVRVPVVMQIESLECGAACLAMVLAYHGRWVALEKVRQDCGVSRDGSNAKNIMRAARKYGMEPSAFRMEPETLMEEGHFPCVVHWNFNHFVVLCGFSGGKAIINDPDRGNIRVPLAEFDKCFTGVVIEFEPGEDFKTEGKRNDFYTYIKNRIQGSGGILAFVFLTTLITALIEMMSPGFSRIILDRLITGRNPDWVVPVMGSMIAFTFLQVLATGLKSLVSYRVEGKIDVVGSAKYVWKVLRLPMEFFSQRMAGDIQGRIARASSISKMLVYSMIPLNINVCMMVAYLFVMFRYSPIIAVMGIVLTAISIFVSQRISTKRLNITRRRMRDNAKLEATTVSGIDMIETIKASGSENGFFEKWASYQAWVNTSVINYTHMDRYIGVIPEILQAITTDFAIIIGVYLIFRGEFTVGMIAAILVVITYFMAPAGEVISAAQELQEARADFERIEDVMHYPEDVSEDEVATDDISYSKLTGKFELKNVTFGYSELAPPLIENFSMNVEAGARIAFVGASGCGKSTLSKLITGLYKPWSGEILFDGKKISEIDRDTFTGSLAVVDQDIVIFRDTIANNIRLWDRSIEEFEMILAARDAYLHDDIMERNDGYDHLLLEGGRDLSGGQRQRLEIARVLAQDPTIVILDEATSDLDAVTEKKVINSIKARGITTIVVAHRLSTVKDCDEIIVLDKGKVVERGTHDELIKKDGLYKALVMSE